MSGLPPPYAEATSPYPPTSNQTAPPSEKSPYPPEQLGAYPPQTYAPQTQTPYPPQPQGQYPQTQQPYPPVQQPYPTAQQQPYPTAQQPAHYPQGYPQGYVPHAPGYPPAPTQPPRPAQAPVSQVTVVQGASHVHYSGGSNSFVGVLVCAGISIFFCFPLGIAAIIVAFLAYSAFSERDYPRAVGMSRVAMSLAISAYVCGIIVGIISLSLNYTVRF